MTDLPAAIAAAREALERYYESEDYGVSPIALRDLLTAIDAAIEAEEMSLVALLKPRIFIDGNKWCVLYGENVQDGVAGFGETPRLAVYDFIKAWGRPLAAANKENGNG